MPTNPGDAWIKGNVGIGTTSPLVPLLVQKNRTSNVYNEIAKFHSVGGYGGGTRIIISADSETHIETNSGYSSAGQRAGSSYFDTDIVNTTTGGAYGAINFYTNNTHRLVIKPNGNVGIGTTSPGQNLEILGTGDAYLRVIGAAGGTKGGVLVGNNDSTKTYGAFWFDNSNNNVYINQRYPAGSLMFGTNSRTSDMVISNTGNVGIGMTPTYQLQLSTDSAAKPSTNTWTIASDRRLKKDIHPYTNGLSIIKRINPVWFKYNGKAGFPNDNQEHIGVIGQEIAKVAPYTVNTFSAKLNPQDKEETKLLNFNSHALTFDLINAVKELDNNITNLSQENQDLKKDNKELKSEIENLKIRLSSLETRTK